MLAPATVLPSSTSDLRIGYLPWRFLVVAVVPHIYEAILLATVPRLYYSRLWNWNSRYFLKHLNIRKKRVVIFHLLANTMCTHCCKSKGSLCTGLCHWTPSHGTGIADSFQRRCLRQRGSLPNAGSMHPELELVHLLLGTQQSSRLIDNYIK